MTKKILIDENANLTLKNLLSQTKNQSSTGLLIGAVFIIIRFCLNICKIILICVIKRLKQQALLQTMF